MESWHTDSIGRLWLLPAGTCFPSAASWNGQQTNGNDADHCNIVKLDHNCPEQPPKNGQYTQAHDFPTYYVVRNCPDLNQWRIAYDVYFTKVWKSPPRAKFKGISTDARRFLRTPATRAIGNGPSSFSRKARIATTTVTASFCRMKAGPTDMLSGLQSRKHMRLESECSRNKTIQIQALLFAVILWIENNLHLIQWHPQQRWIEWRPCEIVFWQMAPLGPHRSIRIF